MLSPCSLRAGRLGPATALLAALLSSLVPACASVPRGAIDSGCDAHADCDPGLLCDPSSVCAPDDCTTGDDCGAAQLGASRCDTLDGGPAVFRCDYDGDRCMEWAGEACPPGATCGAGPDGRAACLGADGKPVAEPPDAPVADEADDEETE